MTAGGMSNSVGPRATRIVDGSTYAVELDLNPIAASILGDLARSSQTWRLRQMQVHPGSPDFTRHLAALVADPAVQAALTVLIHPDAAEQLSGDLWSAKDEPDWCTTGEGSCGSYAVVGDLCREHQAAAENRSPVKYR